MTSRPWCGGARRTRSPCSAALSSTAVKLRALAWELEKTGTDLCVAPALLDVAGPRTTVRPIAGLTLLHVDHPQLSGPRLVMKELFDRSVAGLALVLLAPVMLTLALAIRLSDPGPALFTQIRVGKDGAHVQDLQVPHDGGGCRARLAELRGGTTPTACCSRCAGIRG